MKTIAKYLALFILVLSLQFCVSSERIVVDRTAADPGQEVLGTVQGTASKTGAGKLDNKDKKALGEEAKRDMVSNHPSGKDQTYANLVADFKSTNMLLFTVHKVTLSGNLVGKSSGNTNPTGNTNPNPEADQPEEATNAEDTSQSESADAVPAGSGGKPKLIVNARWGTTPWNKLVPWNDAITHVRIPGGSVSQYTWSSWDHVPQWLRDEPQKRKQITIIDDQLIDEYVKFTKKKNIKTYYCLNINDNIQNQIDILDRLYQAGIEITHLEIGNETYLPKFKKGDKSGLGYAKVITMDDYVALLGDWIPQLKKYSAEVLIVCASRPMDNSYADQYRKGWNDEMLLFIKNHPGQVDGVVIHIYGGKKKGGRGEEESWAQTNLSFMDEFDLPIHVTEGGTHDANWSEAGIQYYKTWHRALYSYLKQRNDGSSFGIHVLYNPRAVPNHSKALYDPNGITPIGRAAMDYPFGAP
jgi:hypothetical protein